MRIEKLYVQNFRNYEEAEISFSDGVNLIYGNNGQGKTNLAEAVYLFSAARSHRTAREKDMIKIGQEAARTKIYFSAAGREMNADFRIFIYCFHNLFHILFFHCNTTSRIRIASCTM